MGEDDDCRECHAEHDMLQHAIAKVDKRIADHDKFAHAELLTREEIEKADARIDDAMRTALLGPIIEHGLHAGKRRRELGIEYKVDQLWQMSQNGGIRAKLSPASLAALWSAGIGAFGVIIAALIGIF